MRKVLAQPKHSGSLPRLLHGILPTLSPMQDGPKMHPSAASHADYAGVCLGLEHAPHIGVVRWNEIWQRVKKQNEGHKEKVGRLTRYVTRTRVFLGIAPPSEWTGTGLGQRQDRNTASSVCWPKQPQTETARCADRYATGDKKTACKSSLARRVSSWKSIRARRRLTVLACWRAGWAVRIVCAKRVSCLSIGRAR